MTEQQKQKVEVYRKQYNEALRKYEGYNVGDTYFGVYNSEITDDNNVTIIMSVITGLGDDYEIKTTINNILIEPGGNSMKLTDIYNASLVYEYVKGLKKIE